MFFVELFCFINFFFYIQNKQNQPIKWNQWWWSKEREALQDGAATFQDMKWWTFTKSLQEDSRSIKKANCGINVTVNSHDTREVSALWRMSCRILEKQKKNFFLCSDSFTVVRTAARAQHNHTAPREHCSDENRWPRGWELGCQTAAHRFKSPSRRCSFVAVGQSRRIKAPRNARQTQVRQRRGWESDSGSQSCWFKAHVRQWFTFKCNRQKREGWRHQEKLSRHLKSSSEAETRGSQRQGRWFKSYHRHHLFFKQLTKTRKNVFTLLNLKYLCGGQEER